MFCDSCGTRLQDRQVYCPVCGKAAGAVPMMPARGRIAGHVRLLGILWLARSAFLLIPGMLMSVIFRHAMPFFPPEVPVFVPNLLRMIGPLFLAGGVVGLVTGWGLLERQPWARMLAIVLGCLSLVEMPLGTALGVYTLWVLLPAASEEEYRQSARAA